MHPSGISAAALVIDASPQGQAIAAKLMAAKRGGYFISGLLDDDPTFQGSRTSIARVIGGIDHVAACAQRLRVTDVIIRQGSVFGRRMRRICETCAAIRVRVMIAESQGEGEEIEVRVRDVELRDLVTHPDPMPVEHRQAVASWVR